MTTHTQRQLSVDDLVWVRAYNTNRAALGQVVAALTSVNGNSAVSVFLPCGYFDWDAGEPTLLQRTVRQIITVELYRIEPLRTEEH